jgi:hypothetical protein
VDASKDGPFEPAPNPVDRDRRPVDRDHTLLEELVWSVALIGGVVAYLVLVAQFAS